MSLFQKAPSTPEEIEQSKPLAIPPEEVLSFDEAEWYAKAYRGESAQLTFRALAMGMVLGFFLSFTNLYIGLKTGWFLGVAVTACILSFSISTFMAKTKIARSQLTILENACMASTASSAGYATGNTLISAIPAMLMMSATEANPGGVQFPWWVLAPWVFCLAALGVVIAIPMKRNMINREKLKFPTGTAAAVTLQSLYSHGKEALAKARALYIAGAAAMGLAIVRDLNVVTTVAADGKVLRHGLLPETSNIFDWSALRIFAAGTAWKPSAWNLKLDHSVVLFGAGAIVGLRTTISMVAGGLFLALFIGPDGLEAKWCNPAGAIVTAATSPGTAWKEIGIWYGAPLLVAYGLLAFGLQWKTIIRSFGSLRGKAGAPTEADDLVARVEVPNSWFIWGALLAGTGIVILGWQFFEIPPHLGALAVVMCFFLGLVSARAMGETDITPGSAMGKIMQLTYGVLIPQSWKANLMTASITSGSGIAAADLLSDLKAGYLLGANPRRQFVAQFAGIFIGTGASILGYFILVPDATAILGNDSAFPAPSAQQWRAVAEVFKVGFDNLHPMAQHGIVYGLAAGSLLAFAEAFLPRCKKWLPSATGFGLGMILPFFYPLAMFLGAFAAWVFYKISTKQADRFVVPISAGFIAGESILGVALKAINNFILK